MLATIKRDGRPQLTKVGYVLDDDGRCWKPFKGHSDYYISQDITEILNLDEQAAAERRVANAFAMEHPDLAPLVKYDSEGSTFVALSGSREAMEALAGTINSLVVGGSEIPP